MKALAAVLLSAAPALGGKKECAEHGERLYVEEPALADIQQAFKHCRPLAENGYGKAQLYMATVYRFGNALTARDGAKMMEMYEKAAAQGMLPAMQALTELYRDTDPAKAGYWKAQLERRGCCR